MKNNKFSENLKEIRLNAKISQKELAKLLNVSDKTISHWEGGYSEPNLDALIKLRDVLKVPYEDLID